MFICLFKIGVWDKVLGPVAEKRAETGTLRLFPVYLKGEDLFGLTVPAVTRITESVCCSSLIPVVVKYPFADECLNFIFLFFFFFAAAPRGGGLQQLLLPLWPQPSGGITSHVQSSWVCTRRAENKLLPHNAGHKVAE